MHLSCAAGRLSDYARGVHLSCAAGRLSDNARSVHVTAFVLQIEGLSNTTGVITYCVCVAGRVL